MKKALLMTFLACLFFSCNKEVSISEENNVIHDISTIDEFIRSYTDQSVIFNWKYADVKMIHSALVQSDSILSIGYALAKDQNVDDLIGLEDKLSEDWIKVRSELLQKVLEFEREVRGQPDLELSALLPVELDDEIPTIVIASTSFKAVEFLKNHELVRYVEPMGYDLHNLEVRSSSGCSSGNTNLNSLDWQQTPTYNAKIPWNFYKHKIDKAWNHSTGDNIGICYIDTGASDYQNNLGSQFNSGASTSRYINKYSTHYSGSWWWRSLDPPHDDCGHGTGMAGLGGAPWSTDGNSVGVAYKSNIVTVRAVEDVLINTSNEKNGVKDALKIAGNRSDIKIASMSIGHIFYSGTVNDGVNYAYNRGKLIFAAAGTSFSGTNWTGVIFPANLSRTVAVTGVKDLSYYQYCHNCHYGSKVDFTIKMQRSNNNDRVSVGLNTSGNNPKYTGGSSCATATTAGIAALVWGKNPNLSRTSVYNRLKNASQLANNRHSRYGYGNINAEAAVLGLSY